MRLLDRTRRLFSAGFPVIRSFTFALALAFASATAAYANCSRDGLSIPTAHPRLWFTPSRLQQARTWFTAHPFTPAADDALANAWVYQMTGNATYAQRAITQLMAFSISETELNGVQSDNYRWADWVPVVFDWVYDQLTPTQVSTFIARYDHYTSVLDGLAWGGPGMPYSNYFWGMERNLLAWGIATCNESPNANAFLDSALITRWQNAFVPAAMTSGEGGVPMEGSQYGRYLVQYPIIPFTTAALEGRSLYREIPFWREAACALVYETSSANIVTPNGSFRQLVPFSDDEVSGGYPSATDSYIASFMSTMADQLDGETPKYVRYWLNSLNPALPYHIAALAGTGPALSPASLPLDYYAPGNGFLFARDQWGPAETRFILQAGPYSGGGHSHLDFGTFQITKADRVLTRETTGYANSIVGYGGAQELIDRTVAHNGLLLGGIGLANAYLDGPPRMSRLESQQDYVFASVDLSQAYRAHDSGHPDRDDNPNVQSVVRDFLYVRPLNVVLILDRMASTSERIPAANVTKTFLLHFPNSPVQESANVMVGTNGSQALRYTKLKSDQNFLFRVVNEGSEGQFRLEAETSGAAQTHLLSMLQMKAANGENVAATFNETSTTLTVNLSSSVGTSTVVFQKGMQSTGGTFTFTPAGGSSRNRSFAAAVMPVPADGSICGDGAQNPPPSPSPTPSVSPTPSATPTATPSPTPTATPNPSPSASPTITPTPSVSPSPSPTPDRRIPAPANVKADHATRHVYLNVSWSRVRIPGTAVSYRVYRSTERGVVGSLLGIATSNSWRDRTPGKGIHYFYTVTTKTPNAESLPSKQAEGWRR